GGLVVKIEAPDFEARRAILELKAAARGVTVADSILRYIAEHLRTSIRELEGALNLVIAHTILINERLDLSAAKAVLRDIIRHTSEAIALADIEQAVCHLFDITKESLKSENRSRTLAYPRMIALYLARKHTRAAYSEIGEYFGGRNHSTVITSKKK